MTYGLDTPTGANPVSDPSWTVDMQANSSEEYGKNFIRKWLVTSEKGITGMPMGQSFVIAQVTEPKGTFFRLVVTGENRGIEEDWEEAEFELDNKELVFEFKEVGTRWVLSLAEDGTLRAVGKYFKEGVHPYETPGEWDANEE